MCAYVCVCVRERERKGDCLSSFVLFQISAITLIANNFSNRIKNILGSLIMLLNTKIIHKCIEIVV